MTVAAVQTTLMEREPMNTFNRTLAIATLALAALGAEAATPVQTGAAVSYRAPDSFSGRPAGWPPSR